MGLCLELAQSASRPRADTAKALGSGITVTLTADRDGSQVVHAALTPGSATTFAGL